MGCAIVVYLTAVWHLHDLRDERAKQEQDEYIRELRSRAGWIKCEPDPDRFLREIRGDMDERNEDQ